VEDARIAFLHVFPYSARSGTPAARMPQLPVPVRKERAARLRALGDAMLARELSTLHSATIEVLVENGQRGRSEHYAAVQLDTDLPAGAIVAARVTGSDGRQLLGTSLHD
jgi:threonylcarbamoyladenosine tRNA methylthiotransferase MtaB